jgi:predicted dehydrogenase
MSRDLTGPVKVAVAGVGYWGPNLVRNLYELGTAEPTWVVDPSQEARDRVLRRYPTMSGAASLDEVLADGSVDAVAIATPVSTHFELAAKALRAGKHVFVEKPLAASTAEAIELVAIAETRGLVLMPGHTFLYSPPVVKIKELIDAGELGDILFVTTSRVNLGLHQPDVSVVWDLGPHDFSILRYLLNELPVSVSAASRSCVLPGIPDVAFINLAFPSETIAHVELSWLAPSKLRRTAIVGSRKMVVYDDTATEPVRIFDTGADLPDPESFGEYRLTYRTGDIVSPRVAATEPLSLELAEFCAAIQDGAPLRSSPQVGVDVIRTIEAVERSLAEGGRPVYLDERATVADEVEI